MATPSIVAAGSREEWKGVPVKYDGTLEYVAATVVSEVVSSGFEATLRKLAEAPLGFQGGTLETPLTERDDFLGTDLTPHSAGATLNFLLWVVVDAERHLVEVRDVPERKWLEPATFDPDGRLRARPGWLPSPRDVARIPPAPLPASVKHELLGFCERHGYRWPTVRALLRQWVTRRLPRSEWCFAPGQTAEASWFYWQDDMPLVVAREAGLIGQLNVYSACGRFLALDLGDVDLLEQLLREAAQPAAHARKLVELWLTHAFREARKDPHASVGFNVRGELTFSISAIKNGEAQTYMGAPVVESHPFPQPGWQWLALCWLA
jgi:hypothetical protein